MKLLNIKKLLNNIIKRQEEADRKGKWEGGAKFGTWN